MLTVEDICKQYDIVRNSFVKMKREEKEELVEHVLKQLPDRMDERIAVVEHIDQFLVDFSYDARDLRSSIRPYLHNDYLSNSTRLFLKLKEGVEAINYLPGKKVFQALAQRKEFLLSNWWGSYFELSHSEGTVEGLFSFEPQGMVIYAASLNVDNSVFEPVFHSFKKAIEYEMENDPRFRLVLATGYTVQTKTVPPVLDEESKRIIHKELL